MKTVGKKTGTTKTKPRSDRQVTGNMGLYYVCYRLSRLGWNVMPTARNAKGIDILGYNSDASVKLSVQVKALSGRNPVPLGNTLDHVLADHVIVCRNVKSDSPEIFILTKSEAKDLAKKSEKRLPDEKVRVSWWIDTKDYEIEQFRERWQIIGPSQSPAQVTASKSEHESEEKNHDIHSR